MNQWAGKIPRKSTICELASRHDPSRGTDRRVLLAELIDQRRPQGPRLVVVGGIGGLQSGLHHHELGDRIDAYILTLVPKKCELAPVAGKQPQKIAIPKLLICPSRLQIGV